LLIFFHKKEFFVVIVIFLLFIYCYFRKKLPWNTIVFMALLFILVSAVKADFRSFLRQGRYVGENPAEKSLSLARLALTKKEVLSKGYLLATQRISHNLMSFAHVVDFTPGVVPYWRGESYRGLLWAPLPRVLFPAKPKLELGQAFGHRYSFLRTDDLSTSWNLPQLVEMYVNFGLLGVIAGMFIIGIIYRLLFEMFCHSASGQGGLLIGVFIFTKLAIIESDFATIFGNIAFYIILLVVINKLMQSKTSELKQPSDNES
jgi:hypothetical protein